MVEPGAMAEVVRAVERLAAGFEPALLAAADAQAVAKEATRASHMLATVAALAAQRAAEAGLWRQQGERSPAHELARLSGSSLTKAKEALDTAEAMGRLPRLEEAARKGEVSPAQAAAIADAASADPSAERRLLERSQRASLGELKDECARTKAGALRDAEARHRAIHAGRHLRKRSCPDGAAELLYRSTPEEVAEVMAVVRGYGDCEFHRAREEGRREPEEAYLADGLLAMARVAADPAGAAADLEGDDDDDGEAAWAGPVAMDEDGDGEQPPPGAGGPGPVEPPVAHQGGACSGGDGNGPRASGDGPEPGDAPAGAMSGKQARLRALYEWAEEAGELPKGAAAALAAKAGDGKPPPGRNGPSPGRRSKPKAGPEPKARRRPVPATVLVRADWDALVRGQAVAGEVCEVAGVGPVPVATVEALMATGDAFLVALLTRGEDVVSAVHLGRRPTAVQKSALLWRDPTCRVEGCNAAVRLEADHRTPWADTKVTAVWDMDHLCGHHHDLKTYQGWALVEGQGKRPMVAPDDPRHPSSTCVASSSGPVG